MAAILRRLTGVPARQMFLKSQRACISTQSGAENSLVKRNETVPQEVPEEEIVSCLPVVNQIETPLPPRDPCVC